MPGWRKAKEWGRQLKNLERTTSHIVYRGGPNKEARVKRAGRAYLAVGRDLSANVRASRSSLCDNPWIWRTGRRSHTSTGCSTNILIWWNGVS